MLRHLGADFAEFGTLGAFIHEGLEGLNKVVRRIYALEPLGQRHVQNSHSHEENTLHRILALRALGLY